ncbi:hypothetical protein AB6A40_004954 [Gnathostoma spinigerum]|uniref:MRG domain-containing protein n=1 Tax=Gnathostoma spinigerum TaxID=75299 RepID=A0ABD6EE11_9BILA
MDNAEKKELSRKRKRTYKPEIRSIQRKVEMTENVVSSRSQLNTCDGSHKKESAVDGEEKLAAIHSVGEYGVNSKILCKFADNFYYEAKIMEILNDGDEPIYTVHYQGWNKRYDESIPKSELAERFLEYTPANINKAKAEMLEFKQKLLDSKRKPQKSLVRDENKAQSKHIKKSPSKKVQKVAKKKISELEEDCIAGTSKSKSRKRKGDTDTLEENIPKIDHPYAPKSYTDFVVQESDDFGHSWILNNIFFDDEEFINKKHCLARIPARITVSDVLKEFDKYCENERERINNFVHCGNNENEPPRKGAENNNKYNYGNFSASVKNIFDNIFGTHLLFRFERPHYYDLLAKHFERKGTEETQVKQLKVENREANSPTLFKPSEIYGPAHLLRMFVQSGRILRDIDLDDQHRKVLLDNAQVFLKFFEKNHEKFFNGEKDYRTAPAGYKKQLSSI